MKEQIEQGLQQLVGLTITGSTRATNMECLKFGAQLISDRQGRLYNVGEFSLHLQCPWRITDREKLLVGSSDLYEPADELAAYDEYFDWDVAGSNLRDVRLLQVLKPARQVTSVKADSYRGGFVAKQWLDIECLPSLFEN